MKTLGQELHDMRVAENDPRLDPEFMNGLAQAIFDAPAKTPVYGLDPDFRRDPDASKPYCCRCQKPLKGKAVAVTVNWESWAVVEGHGNAAAVENSETSNKVIGNEFMGSDCWKQISKKGSYL